MNDRTRWRPWHDSSKEAKSPEETWWTPEWWAAQWRASWDLPSGGGFLLLGSLPVLMVAFLGRLV